MLKGKKERLDILYRLLDTYSAGEIESSLFTFFEKAVNLENIEVSKHYKKLLNDFVLTYGSKLKDVFVSYSNLKVQDKSLKLYWLITNI